MTSQRPETIAAALQDLGYRAQIDTDSGGDPRIRSAIEGVNYSFWFYGCTDNTDCDMVILSTGFSMANPPSPAVINDWNRRKLIGRAYLDNENDPILDQVVVVTGGISTEAFGETVLRWGWAVSDFKQHIGFK